VPTDYSVLLAGQGLTRVECCDRSSYDEPSLTLDYRGIRCSTTVDGSINSDVFTAFVERVLVPTVQPGDLVVMDNLSSHTGQRTPELVRAAKAELVYLPGTHRT
jgi:hypothetical protein